MRTLERRKTEHFLQSRKIPWNLILTFLLLSIGIGIAGYFYYQDQREKIQQGKQEELTAIAELKVKQILNWRHERMANARAIAERGLSPFIWQGFTTGSSSKAKQEILGWMSSLKKYYDYKSVFLLDIKGNLRISIGNVEEPVGSFAKRLALEALKRKEVIFSDLHKGEINDIHL